MNSNKKLLGTSLITAFAASLCCITPVLALISGATGMASSFSWIEPFRPYLIGMTILVLALAWYQKLKTTDNLECDCESDGKVKFMQSKTFLGIVTVFALVMMAFPYYSKIFFPSTEQQALQVDQSDIQSAEFIISGMTCISCEEHVKHEVNKLEGIISANASYEDGNAIVKFDQSKTNRQEIEKRINSTGYKVINKRKK